MKDLVSRITDLKCLLKVNSDNKNQLETKEKCKRCAAEGDTCCGYFPCELAPSDIISIDEDTIIKLLKTGLICIDYWGGDIEDANFFEMDRIYYLRPRVLGDISLISESIFGRCVLLGEDGCILDFEHRPYFGRWLIHCGRENDDPLPTINGKEAACIMWRPYQNILYNVAQKIERVTGKRDAFDDIVSMLGSLMSNPDNPDNSNDLDKSINDDLTKMQELIDMIFTTD